MALHDVSDSIDFRAGGSRANFDGGAMIVSASLDDIRNFSNTKGNALLHDVSFVGLNGVQTDRTPFVNFDNISSNPEKPSFFDRLPFIGQNGDDKSLHEQLCDKFKEGMDPKQRTELDKQEEAYKKAFDRWALGTGFLNPPDLDDYPLVKAHTEKVEQAEREIARTVFDGLTQDERSKLDYENNPLGPAFAPKPMHEEVTKRIREATRKYIDGNNDGKQVSQREHRT